MDDLAWYTLTTALRVEGPDIIVHSPRGFVDELLLEDLSAEEGHFGLGVQRPVHGYSVG
jgi:hypothetical protein